MDAVDVDNKEIWAIPPEYPYNHEEFIADNALITPSMRVEYGGNEWVRVRSLDVVCWYWHRNRWVGFLGVATEENIKQTLGYDINPPHFPPEKADEILNTWAKTKGDERPAEIFDLSEV
jgi:hypothetical protein